MDDISLPEIFPVFPLTGALMLPGSKLPFHIFEQRYRNMIEDALEKKLPIGMIQPIEPRDDNSPKPGADLETPSLYSVGCAGKIHRFEKTDDGRYLLVLAGASRFRVVEELAMVRGYRQIRANFSEFEYDLQSNNSIPDTNRLLNALREFGDHHKIKFDVSTLSTAPAVPLLNGLAMSLPFTPAEKQALLEAPKIDDREELLLTLMGMNTNSSIPKHHDPPPVIN